MKVLLIAPELFTTDSGIPRMLRLYLKALCENAPVANSVGFVTLNDTEIDSKQLQAYSTSHLSTWAACARSKFKFVRETLQRSRNADTILCGHIAQLPVAWLASLLRPKLKIILIAHGIEIWRPFGFWERLALNKAHRILCVSDFTRREILQQIRLDERRLVVVPNALDPYLVSHRETNVPPASDQPVILTVSRLTIADNYKGVDHLISAMPAILESSPKTVLRIIGRGDDIPRLQNLRDQLALSDSVQFAGFVSDEQLPLEFAGATCFALPSLKEGFGLVYLEAMSAGKPCLGAKAGGAPEVITPESGTLVSYGDITAITKGCLDMLTKIWDPAVIRACAEKFSYPRFKTRLAAALSSS